LEQAKTFLLWWDYSFLTKRLTGYQMQNTDNHCSRLQAYYAATYILFTKMICNEGSHVTVHTWLLLSW